MAQDCHDDAGVVLNVFDFLYWESSSGQLLFVTQRGQLKLIRLTAATAAYYSAVRIRRQFRGRLFLAGVALWLIMMKRYALFGSATSSGAK